MKKVVLTPEETNRLEEIKTKWKSPKDLLPPEEMAFVHIISEKLKKSDWRHQLSEKYGREIFDKAEKEFEIQRRGFVYGWIFCVFFVFLLVGICSIIIGIFSLGQYAREIGAWFLIFLMISIWPLYYYMHSDARKKKAIENKCKMRKYPDFYSNPDR